MKPQTPNEFIRSINFMFSSNMNQGSGILWSAVEDQFLRDNWFIHSASEVAAQMPGRTRNMVIGRANRLGLRKGKKRENRSRSDARNQKIIKLASNGTPITEAVAKVGLSTTAIRDRARTLGVKFKKATNKPVKKQTVSHVVKEAKRVIGDGVSLFAVGNGQCHFMLDGYGSDGLPRCCGEPAYDGLPYCAHHARSVYATPKDGVQ